MGKRHKHVIDGQLAIVAWANLVGAIVETMKAADAGNALIHTFLDELENANEFILRGGTRRFARDIVGIIRLNVPGNDE